MASSSEVDDLENQQAVASGAIDRGGSWLASFWSQIHSLFHQNPVKPSPTDEDSEELELTRTTHLAPASPDHVSDDVILSVDALEDHTIAITTPIPDQSNPNGEDDNHAVTSKSATSKSKSPKIQLRQPNPAVVTVTQALPPSFLKLLRRSCFNWIVCLLSVCVALSILYGIQQDGPGSGWLEGAVAAVAIVILVFTPTLIKHFSFSDTRIKSEMEVRVCRGENIIDVSPSDIVVGDIVCLEVGSIVPADGMFVISNSPGESLELEDGTRLPKIDESNRSLVYGAKVVMGFGRMEVTRVRMETTCGKLMAQVRTNPNLQDKYPAQLERFSKTLQIVGLVITILLLLVLIIRALVLKEKNGNPGLQADQFKSETSEINNLVDIVGRFFKKSSGEISKMVTCLPLLIAGLTEGVPFSIALAIAYWNKVTLSKEATAQSNLSCLEMAFVDTICIGDGLTSNPKIEVDMTYDGNQIIETDRCVVEVHEGIRASLYNGIAMMPRQPSPSSSSEQKLLLSWAKSNLGLHDNEEKESGSDEEAGETIEEKILYRSGSATTMLPLCSEYYDSNAATKLMDESKRREFEECIMNMQYKRLKPLAFAHMKIHAEEEDQSLTLIALLGVDKLEESIETMLAKEALRKAKVEIIDFPKDDNEFEEGETPIDGRGRPSDKLHAVQRLKDNGRFVAMVATRTNEIAAMKETDVGIAIGASSSHVTKEGSDLIIHHGSLSLLVTIIRTGRCIRYNIQRYIQVELTANVSLLVTISITTMSLGHCTIGSLEALLATSLVALCALALLVEPPTEELMEKVPVKQTGPLIPKHTWRNVILQASYQACVLVILHLKWEALPGIKSEKNMEAMVLNVYVLCQMFNLVNTREPEKKNIFRDVHRSRWLWLAVGVSIIMHVAFVEIADKSLGWGQWGLCVLVAMVSWLVDLGGKCVYGVMMKNKATIGSDHRSASLGSAGSSKSASSRVLLASLAS